MKLINLFIARRLMLLLNISIILGICILIAYTTDIIVRQGLTEKFIYQIAYLPRSPSDILFTSVVLILLYFLNLSIRENMPAVRNNKYCFIISCAIDIIICFSLILLVNVSYKGILLLSGAYMLYFVKTKFQRFIFIGLFFFFYIVCDYDIISRYTHMMSLNTYINYLSGEIRTQVYIFKNVLSSCNDVLFIAYMIFWIQLQIEETSNINKLYEQQYRTNEELKLANLQLEHYIEQAEQASVLRERNRMAREIHDTIGHSLTAISTGIDTCRELLGSDQQKCSSYLAALSQISRESLDDVRRSVKQLRPDCLNRLSLHDAISNMASNISAITSTKVSFTVTDRGDLSEPQKEALYRIIQESITNSVKHGKATIVGIRLTYEQSGTTLLIEDNGEGCKKITPGTGLSSIMERVHDLNGNVYFNGDHGFITSLFIPYQR